MGSSVLEGQRCHKSKKKKEKKKLAVIGSCQFVVTIICRARARWLSELGSWIT